MHKRYRRFLLVLIVPILLLLPIGLLNRAFLENAGELTPLEEVVHIQQTRGGLYGTALHANDYAYKLELYRARRPEIVVIGSSRVLQFRQALFTRPFANLGLTVNYPAEALKLIDDMLKISTPKVVIFGIDHYWLNTAYVHALNFRSHDVRGGNLSPDALVTPLRWLADGRIDPNTYRDLVVSGRPNAADKLPMIGARAILDGDGFGPDGSWYYNNVIYGRRPSPNPGFSETLRRIAIGGAQFRYGAKVDPARMADLRLAVTRLLGAGVGVVTFIPPMATPALSAMDALGDAYAYAKFARAEIATLGVEHGDFLDGAVVGISNCEFIDGFHVGEVGTARLLVALAAQRGSVLADFVDGATASRVITTNAGNAAADRRFMRVGEQEQDFLALGCPKHTRTDLSGTVD